MFFNKEVLWIILLFINNAPFAATLFDPAIEPIASLARLAISHTDLQSNQETVFPFTFEQTNWTGDINAKTINTVAQIQTIGPWGVWTAASRLALLNTDTDRKIVTYNGNKAIPFRWTDLSINQQASLGDEVTGSKCVDYIRGDRSHEGLAPDAFRVRKSLLGDIIHANIFYWKIDAAQQQIYVGANDGMLHVFNALTAEEIYAYIPSMLIGDLIRLTKTPYEHTYFVDGNISIANVAYQNAVKSILVGGLGAGGKGLYGLDVTDTSADDESSAAQHIKWEITPDSFGFGDLGYTYGIPKITRLNDGTPAVIVGNGYMNSGKGHAVLYIINLDTGILIKAIDTGAGNSQSPNGLSSPTIFDANGDGKVDYVYAGDLDGHIWKFNLNSQSLADYSVLDSGGNTGPLFMTSPQQAITTAPVVTAHPTGLGQLIVFATGRLLSEEDINNPDVHYVYGVWDGAPSSNTALLEQNIVDSGLTMWRIETGYLPLWDADGLNHKGWRLALPVGEQVVGENPFKENGRFYFVSKQAIIYGQGTRDFKNWFYELDINTGGSPKLPIFDMNNDALLTDLDLVDGCLVSVNMSCIPIAKLLGMGLYSQPIYLQTKTLNSVLFSHLAFQSGSQFSNKVIEPIIPIGLTITSVITTNFGHIKTTTTTYSDLTLYILNAISNADGSITIKQVFRDGSVVMTELPEIAEATAPPITTPKQEGITDKIGRISWREIFSL